MSTLTQLYTRIILDLDRDDMGSGGGQEQAKIDAVIDAVAHYQSEQFWFNRANGTGNTSASTATIAMPSGVLFPHTVSYLGVPLQRVPLEEIQHRTETGIPTSWAENEGTIQLWPIPNATYSIAVYGLASTGVPALGSDTNIWTTEAYELILARAKRILLRGTNRDPEGAAMAQADEREALEDLRRKTSKRGQANLRTDFPLTAGFNINQG